MGNKPRYVQTNGDNKVNPLTEMWEFVETSLVKPRITKRTSERDDKPHDSEKNDVGKVYQS